MKLIFILIAIIICIILLLFSICACILNAQLDKSRLRYHLFDEEGDCDGKTNSRKSN